MSIQVNDFRWEPGKNDAEYIKLLKSSRDEWQKIAKRAIAKLTTLSKAQEPRLLTLDDIAAWVRQKPMDREPIYVEVKDLLGTWGAWMVDEIASYLPETDLSGELYGKTWRVWSAKPTDEQRKAVSWND